MKITYVTHACVLVEVGGVRLLTDPWLAGPCWGGNIWHYPPPKLKPEDLTDIDFIYFSHAHDDHLHPQSLRRLRPEVKKAQVVIPSFEAPYFEKAVRANGFNNIKILNHEESLEVAPGVRVEMFVNDIGDDDSSLLVQTDDSMVFFQTDNLMSVNEARRIGQKYSIDAVFTIASLTGIYPGFFDFPPEVMMRLASQKRARSLNYSMDIVMALGAKVAVPYASDLCYLGDLYFANDLHKGDKRNFVKLAQERKADVSPILMGPGDSITIQKHEVRSNLSPHDFGGEKLATHAVAMRHDVEAIRLEEHQYDALPYTGEIEKLRAVLDSRASRWTGGGGFRVLWKIIGKNGEMYSFGQQMPNPTEVCTADWNYDLSIELPSYRLQRLAKGDYKMGFITLWNGSALCHRHVEDQTAAEKAFWSWAFDNVRLQ